MKATPAPTQACPGPGTSARATARWRWPAGWKRMVSCTRMTGCQPSWRMRFHSRGLHSPWSASTSTVIPGGTAGRSQRSSRRKCGIQAPGWLAGRRCQATGMAAPR